MKEHIHIFKTNIKTPEDTAIIARALNIDAIYHWSVDTCDCDCVLRVITPTLSSTEMINIITNEGYQCSELNN